ncbi:MAG: PIN domain-containing protein [bacterium]
MKPAYIDSSFLLSIVFEDERYDLSIDIWNSLDILLGSIIMEIECRINIYKYCLLSIKDKELYHEKDAMLSRLLNSINKKVVDNEVLLEIKNNDWLKRLRSLDSIHLATANIYKKLIHDKLLICSYDANMIKIARELGMETIKKE